MQPQPPAPDWEHAYCSHVVALGLSGASQAPELRKLEDRLYVWATFTAMFIDGTSRMNAGVDLYIDEGGHAQCRRVELFPVPGEPEITGDTVRSFPLAKLRDLAIRYAARQLQSNADGTPVFVSGADAAERALERVRAAKPPARRRPRVSDETLATVAQVYRSAPSRPTTAVAEHFERAGRWISKATAARYVAKAREAGYLGRSPGKGRAGEEPSPLATIVSEGEAPATQDRSSVKKGEGS